MRKIEIGELTDNTIKLISENWMLISAGNQDKFNLMTASWGGTGFLWNKAVAFIFVRPERHTFSFIETETHFTLSFFEQEYKDILTFCGTKSGRDTDKIKETGLTPYFTELGNPVYREAIVTFECRKMYAEMLSDDAFIDKIPLSRWYGENNGLHKMYIAEIVNVWIEN